MKHTFFLIVISIVLICCKQNETKEPESLADLKIAYNVFEDPETDNYEIYIMNPDGSGKKNISNTAGIDWVYYAYGVKLYFVSDRDTAYRVYFLYEMDSDGNNVRKISDIELQDSYLGTRKNGEEIIVLPKTKIDSVFLIINSNGEIIQSVFPDLPYIADPFFSPDGNQIVFRGGKIKSELGPKYIDELYIMNVEGGTPNQLTYYPANDTTAEWFAYRAGPPIWEPNKKIISFASKQNGNYSIFTIKPDGTELTQITPDSTNEVYHSWSPSGEWIVFDGVPEEDNYDILLMNFESKEIKRLTTDTKYEQGPVFVRKAN